MENNITKKQLFGLGVIVLLAITLPLALFLAKNQQEIRKEAAGTGIVKLSLDPEQGTKNQDESFTVNVQLISTQTASIALADIDLEFDTNVFIVNSIACANPFSSTARAEVENNKIHLTCFQLPGSDPLSLTANQPVSFGSFQMTVKTDAPDGNSPVSFSRTIVPDAVSSGNLADEGTTANYTIISGQTTTPTATLSPGATATSTPTMVPGQVQIQFEIKFNGIDQQRADQPVVLKITKAGQVLQTLDNVILSADAQGVYQSQILALNTAVEPGAGYKILIKGEKHLRSEYCQASGQNTSCAGGNLELTSGLNQFDFTDYPLFPGDLPLPGFGQDTVVNSQDAIFMVNCFSSPEEASCLSTADLNLDSIINSLDMNIMNQTFQSRWEDE